MEISFRTRKLEGDFSSVDRLRRVYGERADILTIRIAVLKNAHNLSMVPTTRPERRHPLAGRRSNQFTVDVTQPYRLVFEPNHDPVPLTKDGGIDLTKVTSTNQFTPDYAVSPGTVLQERLDVMGWSQAEFARRCGRTPKLISEIMSGKAPVETETAIQFERVTGLHASIWLGIESDYRLLLTRQAEVERSKGSEEWVNEFPISELGCVDISA